jgi:hypothetical protein
MQMTVGDIDFSPTLDETESARAALRTHILKDAGEQLTALNAALPGRSYRIAQITFEPDAFSAPRPIRSRPMIAMASAALAPAPSDSGQTQDHSQKLVLRAHIVYAALPPLPVTVH